MPRQVGVAVMRHPAHYTARTRLPGKAGQVTISGHPTCRHFGHQALYAFAKVSAWFHQNTPVLPANPCTGSYRGADFAATRTHRIESFLGPHLTPSGSSEGYRQSIRPHQAPWPVGLWS